MIPLNKTSKWIITGISILIIAYSIIITIKYSRLNTLYLQDESLTENPENKKGLKEIRSGEQYRFINPLLDCYEIKSTKMRFMKEAELKINEFIKEEKAKQHVELVSVYYRDLNNGPWMGIKEDSAYSPASLLKVPVMLAALKQAQQLPGFLETKIEFKPEDANQFQPNIVGERHVLPGNSYQIKELIQYMIVYSDNDAQSLLTRNISRENYNDVFMELGIDLMKYRPMDNFLSVKEYASYFRILYNATYLNKEMSEQALTLLGYTKYKNGIVAGVPPGVIVAHKFGERFYPETNIKQLHDCGIVYKPGKPYLLCIMTRGNDFNNLERIISTISKIMYDSVK